jgi:hypothetical protein
VQGVRSGRGRGSPPPGPDTADTFQMPLLTVPPHADLRDVEPDVVRLVVERESQIERLGHEVYARLMQCSIEGGGLTGLVSMLSEVSAKPSVVQDVDGTISATAGPDESVSLRERITPIIASAGRYEDPCTNETATEEDRWACGLHSVGSLYCQQAVVPIVIAKEPAEWVSVLE